MKKGVLLLIAEHEEFASGLNNGQSSWWETRLQQIMVVEFKLEARMGAIEGEMKETMLGPEKLRRLLTDLATAVQKKELSAEPSFVSGLDVLYRGMLANGVIRRVGDNAFELAQPELLRNASKADRRRAAESVKAISQWANEREALLAVAEQADEVYEVAVS